MRNFVFLFLVTVNYAYVKCAENSEEQFEIGITKIEEFEKRKDQTQNYAIIQGEFISVDSSQGILQNEISELRQELNKTKEQLRELEENNPHWAQWTMGQKIPYGAVLAGNNREGHPAYVGRVQHNGEHAVVKIIPTFKYAAFPYGNQEIPVTSCEILIGWGFSWVWDYHGRVPHNAFSCGSDANGRPLYIGRGHHDGSLSPGTVNSALGCMKLPHSWKVHKYLDYEVLVRN